MGPCDLLQRIHQSTSDEPLPSGVTPIQITASLRRSGRLEWRVTSAAGVRFPLSNPLNRVTIRASRGVSVTDVTADGATIHATRRGSVTLTYERRRASGDYRDVVSTRDQVGVT